MTISLSLIIALLTSLTTLTNAQWSIGAKGGANFSHVQMVGLDLGLRPDINWLIGGQAGMITEYKFNNTFSVLSELNYTEKGFITAAEYDLAIQDIDIPVGVKAETRLRYLDIPLMAKYRVYDGSKVSAYVTAGGYFGYGINGNLKTKARLILDFNLSNTSLNLANKNFDRTEFGGVIGGGIEIPAGNGKFILDARYSHAYNPLIDDFLVDLRLRNRGFSLGLGYTYTFSVQEVDRV